MFLNCPSLRSIEVGENNPNYCSVNGVLFSKDKTTLILYPPAVGDSYTIPDSVTSVGDYAFLDCISLRSVTIPDSVKGIGEHAFENCTSLAAVIFGGSMISIGDSAFSGCTSLTSLIVPDSVISIGRGAFRGCTSLTSVKLGGSVGSIGDFAFEGCDALGSVVIPVSVRSIGDSAFSECTELRYDTGSEVSQDEMLGIIRKRLGDRGGFDDNSSEEKDMITYMDEKGENRVILEKLDAEHLRELLRDMMGM